MAEQGPAVPGRASQAAIGDGWPGPEISSSACHSRGHLAALTSDLALAAFGLEEPAGGRGL